MNAGLNGSLSVIGSNIFVGAFQHPSDSVSSGGVFISTDNGTTWRAVNNGLTWHTINVLFASGADLYAGTNCGTYVPTNEGASWKFVSAGSLADSMVVLSLAVSSSQLIVGTLNGVWCYPLSQLIEDKYETNETGQRRKGG